MLTVNNDGLLISNNELTPSFCSHYTWSDLETLVPSLWGDPPPPRSYYLPETTNMWYLPTYLTKFITASMCTEFQLTIEQQ